MAMAEDLSPDEKARREAEARFRQENKPAQPPMPLGVFLFWVMAGLVVIVVVFQLAEGDSTSEPDDGLHDASAKVTCTHVRNVMADAGDGILTGSELRAKIREADRTAQVAGPQLAEPVRDMLRAVTADDSPAFIEAALATAQACRTAGY